MFKLLVIENQKPLVVIVEKEVSEDKFNCRVANTDEQIIASSRNLKPLSLKEYTFKKASFHFKNVSGSFSKDEINIIEMLLSKYKPVLTPDEFICLLNGELQRDVTPYLKSKGHIKS